MASDVIDEFYAPLVVTATSVSTSSSAAVQAHSGGATGKQKAVFFSTVDCYLRFGTSGVSAASSEDELLPANTCYPVNLTNSTTYFRVLGTDSGTLYSFIEGYAG
jgi:hypothetical protein